MLSSNITFAKLRKADPEIDRDAYPTKNLLYRIASYPFELAMKVMCTAKFLFERSNPLKWYKPQLFELVDRVSGWLRVCPESTFISYFPTFFGTFYHLQDPVAIKALFKHFRGGSDNQSLLTPTRSIKTLCKTIKDVFPDDGITDEDIMFTCSSKNSNYYRTWLHHLLDGKHIKEYRPLICEEAQKTLEKWAEGCSQHRSVPIFETSLFASGIITKLLLGQKVGGEALAKAVNFINWYTIHKQLGVMSKKDTAKYQQALATFRQIVEKIINDQKAPLFAEQESHSLSTAQKKVMAFIIFFAGQETTAFLLACILLYLAQNPNLQWKLRDLIGEKGRDDEEVKKEIEKLINQCLANYPPSYAISRRVGEEDLCFEYQLEGEGELRKLIMPSGTLISARMMDAAKRIMETAPEKINQECSHDLFSAFGGGPNGCIGKKLALIEAFEFTIAALEGYTISSNLPQETEPRVVGQITLQYVDDITLTVLPL